MTGTSGKKTLLLSGAGTLVVVGAVYLVLASGTHGTSAAALDAFYRCHEGGNNRNPCFKELAQEVVTQGEEAAMFEAFTENQQEPRVFESCHVFTHFMGQDAYVKYGSVPAAISYGNHVCFAGFYHGVLEGDFIANRINVADEASQEALRERIPTICSPLNSAAQRREYNECLHGIGHALMFATSGELPQALAFCDALAPQGASWCYSGVFMENSTSTTNPDHPSAYLKKDDPLYPCNILAERYLTSCYTLQSMYFAQLVGGDWEKNRELCMQVPEAYRAACFNGYGQNLTGYLQDPAAIHEECLAAPSHYRASCIQGAVGGMGAKYAEPAPIISAFCGLFEGEARRTCAQASLSTTPQ